MALDIKIDSLDGLDDAVAGLYKKRGTGFILDVSGVESHPNVLNLRKAMQDERDARKNFEKNFKNLQSDLEKTKEIDPTKYTDALSKLANFEQEEIKRNQKKLKDKEKWEELNQQLEASYLQKIDTLSEQHQLDIAQHKEKISELDKSKAQELELMSSALETHLKDKEIVAALAQEGGNIPILMPHVAKFVKVLKESVGGKEDYFARVIDAQGTTRINDKGEPMSITDLVIEFKDKPEFKGDGIFKVKKQSGGSGSAGNRGGEGGFKDNPWKKESWNLTKQCEAVKEDKDKAARMKAEASAA